MYHYFNLNIRPKHINVEKKRGRTGKKELDENFITMISDSIDMLLYVIR